MISKKYIIPGVLVIVALVAWLAFGSDTKKTVNLYTKPKTGPFKVNVTTTGELQAKKSTSIKGPQGMRRIGVYHVTIQRLVPEGTIVKKGDFVAELDRSNVMNALQDAKLNLKQQQTQLEQARLDTAQTLSQARDNVTNLKFNMKQSKIAVKQSKYESPATQQKTKNDYEKAKRQYNQAKMSLKRKKKAAQAKIQRINIKLRQYKNKVNRIQKIMSDFTIRAPQKGMVIYKRNRDGSKLKQGDQISAWDPVVAQLPDFSVMQSVTYVNEVDIQKVHKGQKVNIGLDAYPDKHLTGVVTNVANIGQQRQNSSSKVFQVTIRVNQSDSTLRPAMSTRNVIHTNSVDSALYVPLETIHTYHDSLNIVYKHHGGKAIMQQVILGLINNNDAIIKAGVNPGDQLYLSTPTDTANIRKEFLSKKTIEKYKKKKQENTHPQSRSDSLQKRKLQMRHHRGTHASPPGRSRH
ncbi:MAG TPA: efflux RND transporter periplasmic adaptor subunit [Balneolaceae bacterium]|nr:efflux RND transporter periplasmic adaptor subunit [Balneolaceae bacterium]